ncbi:hypothetical protein V0U79_11545, partial [Hyphobacterium sp. HN65]
PSVATATAFMTAETTAFIGKRTDRPASSSAGAATAAAASTTAAGTFAAASAAASGSVATAAAPAATARAIATAATTTVILGKGHFTGGLEAGAEQLVLSLLDGRLCFWRFNCGDHRDSETGDCNKAGSLEIEHGLLLLSE